MLYSQNKKSFNDVLADAINENEDNYQEFLRKEKKSFAMELKAVGDMSTANVTGGSRYGQIFDPNIIQNPNRKVHMSQVLRGGSIGAGNTYTFMRENGNGEGADINSGSEFISEGLNQLTSGSVSSGLLGVASGVALNVS